MKSRTARAAAQLLLTTAPSFVIQEQLLLEHQHAAVAKRLERRHVAAIEMPANDRSVAACLERSRVR
jgi:hypothetical protein